MKIYLTVTFLFIVIVALGQTSSFEPKYITALDVESGKQLMKFHYRSSSKAKKVSVITDSVLNIIIKRFDEIKLEKSFNGQQIADLQNYAYQVIEIEVKKKKYVYINAFRIGKNGPDMEGYQKDWRTKPIIVHDGGKSFWQIFFDLETKKFFKLAINGMA